MGPKEKLAAWRREGFAGHVSAFLPKWEAARVGRQGMIAVRGRAGEFGFQPNATIAGNVQGRCPWLGWVWPLANAARLEIALVIGRKRLFFSRRWPRANFILAWGIAPGIDSPCSCLAESQIH